MKLFLLPLTVLNDQRFPVELSHVWGLGDCLLFRRIRFLSFIRHPPESPHPPALSPSPSRHLLGNSRQHPIGPLLGVCSPNPGPWEAGAGDRVHGQVKPGPTFLLCPLALPSWECGANSCPTALAPPGPPPAGLQAPLSWVLCLCGKEEVSPKHGGPGLP